MVTSPYGSVWCQREEVLQKDVAWREAAGGSVRGQSPAPPSSSVLFTENPGITSAVYQAPGQRRGADPQSRVLGSFPAACGLTLSRPLICRQPTFALL